MAARGFPDTQCIRGNKDKERSSSQSKKRSNNGRKGTADPCENYKGRAEQRTAS